VPAANYEVMGNLVNTRWNGMEKKPRRLISDDIHAFSLKNRFPSMAHYTPNERLTRKNYSICLQQKAVNPSFVDDSMYKGQTSPRFHNVEYRLVEKSVISPKYSKVGSHERRGPSYLQPPSATKNVSPHTYRTDEAFKRTS
jgi:hypothetical protein